MNYAQIFLCDIANGPGCRTSVFVSGCTHYCKGCFNEAAWDFQYGKEFTTYVQNKLIEESNLPYIEGFTFLGGEPMEVVNQRELRPFIERIKRELPEKNIWIYSGYTFEEILEDDNRFELLKECDVLVDGRFDYRLKDLTLKFRGSSNQRIIDVKNTLESGNIILFME